VIVLPNFSIKCKNRGTPRFLQKIRGKEKRKEDLKHCIFIIISICEEKKWINFKFLLSCAKNIKKLFCTLQPVTLQKEKTLV
jgi:hypothetical protein